MYDVVPVKVSAKTHPFAPAPKRMDVAEGKTLAELVLMSFDGHPMVGELMAHGYIRVSINGDPIPAGVWHLVRPKKGTLVNIVTTPGKGGGGGAKKIMTVVVAIAVIAFAPEIAAGLNSAFSLTGATAISSTSIIMSGVSMLFNLALGALVKPPTPNMGELGGYGGTRTSPTLSITGTQNRANQHGVVPRVYGKHRVFPSLAARPYITSQAKTQTIYMLFDLGPGQLLLSYLKIGETAIGQYEDVEVDIIEGASGDTMSSPLYSRNHNQATHSLRLLSGVEQIITSPTGVETLQFVLAFDGLVQFTGSGARANQTVAFDAFHRISGSADAWVPFQDGYNSTQTTGAAVTSAPVNEYYTIYQSDYVYNGGDDSSSFNITVSTPTAYRGVTLSSVEYIISAKQASATSYVQYATLTVAAGSSETVELVPPVGEKIDVKIALGIRHYDALGTDMLANDGATAYAVPAPTFSYPTPVNTGAISITAKTEHAHRLTYTAKGLNGTDAYDIKITRSTADNTDTSIRNDSTLTSITAVGADSPVNITEHCLVALKIRATEQLSGMVSTFNCVASSVLPVWDGASWTNQETNNPAWVFCDILRGSANYRPLVDARLDLATILLWANACDAEPPQGSVVPTGFTPSSTDAYWTFNGVMDTASTVYEMLTSVAALGRASLAMVDGKFSVVRDTTRSTPVQMFTPRNSSGFRGTKAFINLPHALKVKFVNPDNDWKQDEITTYADGYDIDTATKFETLHLWGCTDKRQAWREARYHIAVGTLRPETFELLVDVENLVCTRGDLIKVAHDVSRWGLEQGRIKAIGLDGGGDVATLTLDEPVTMDGVSAYNIRVRKSDGVHIVGTVTVITGTTSTVTLSPVIPIADTPAIGDLWAFGVSSLETVDLIVTEIVPGADLTARIVMQDYGSGIFTADSGTIPDYDPQQTFDPADVTPAAVEGLTATETYVVNSVRVAEYSLGVTWESAPAYYSERYHIFRKTAGRWVMVDTAFTNSYVFSGTRGEQFEIAVSAVNRLGKFLVPSAASNTIATIAGVDPTDVSGLNLTVIGDKIRFDWDQTSSTVAEHWRVKYSSAIVGASWPNSVELVKAVYQPTVDVPARTGSYLFKAVDEQGSESANETISITTAPGLNTLNVVSTQTEDSTFSGTKTNTWLGASGLQLDVAGLFDDEAGNFEDVAGFFDGAGGDAYAIGYYDFDMGGLGYVDLSQVYTSRVTVGIEHIATTYNSGEFDAAEGFFDVATSYFDGSDPADVNVTVQIATTEDDPSSTPTWTDWTDFVVGDYKARAIKMRAILEGDGIWTTPSITALSAVIDMPDGTRALNDVTTDAAGSAITFTPAFKALEGLAITGDNLQQGDYWTVTSKSRTGFTVRFFDSGDVGVARNFDYIAKGYGAVA